MGGGERARAGAGAAWRRKAGILGSNTTFEPE